MLESVEFILFFTAMAALNLVEVGNHASHSLNREVFHYSVVESMSAFGQTCLDC